jgi:hypothetical protein
MLQAGGLFFAGSPRLPAGTFILQLRFLMLKGLRIRFIRAIHLTNKIFPCSRLIVVGKTFRSPARQFFADQFFKLAQ